MAGILVTRSEGRIPLIKHRGVDSYWYHQFGFHFGQYFNGPEASPEDTTKTILLSNGGFLLYDGEIYNYPEKYESDRAYLKALFDAETDIHSITDYANHWDGSWAIVFISYKGFIYCFTDPLGKRQLYYNERCEISSEIRPLVRDQAFDPFYKSSAYKWGYNTNDSTPWCEVKRVIPNKLYVFVSGLVLNIHAGNYYDWLRYVPAEDIGLEQLLTEAVSNRLKNCHSKIGVLLSGGLDSAIVAAILRDLGANHKVNYYTIENNETGFAEHVADHLGVDLEYMPYVLDETLAESLKWNETPIDLGSVVPQHTLLGNVPEGIVMTGDGADELFGGYRRSKIYDSQRSDIFEELTYYHLPRLDRAAGRFGLNLRTPFLSHDVVKYALNVPYADRIDKSILKSIWGAKLPQQIIDRPKMALKNDQLIADSEAYKIKVFDSFYKQFTK